MKLTKHQIAFIRKCIISYYPYYKELSEDMMEKGDIEERKRDAIMLIELSRPDKFNFNPEV